jgi:hypothetical protein
VTRAPAADKASRTACARVLVRGGTDEKTGEALSAATLAERVAWCAALVQGMAARLTAGHWNPADVESLASGRDGAGKPLPAMAWMALLRRTVSRSTTGSCGWRRSRPGVSCGRRAGATAAWLSRSLPGVADTAYLPAGLLTPP